MQAFGQPMAVMPILMGATSVVLPPEGPFASAMFNTTRALGSIAGGALLTEFLHHRQQIHSNLLLNHAGNSSYLLSQPYEGGSTFLAPLNKDGSAISAEILGQFSQLVRKQSLVLGISDSYLAIIVLALSLTVLAFLLPKRTFPP